MVSDYGGCWCAMVVIIGQTAFESMGGYRFSAYYYARNQRTNLSYIRSDSSNSNRD
jgi:hypothetical protein